MWSPWHTRLPGLGTRSIQGRRSPLTRSMMSLCRPLVSRQYGPGRRGQRVCVLEVQAGLRGREGSPSHQRVGRRPSPTMGARSTGTVAGRDCRPRRKREGGGWPRGKAGRQARDGEGGAGAREDTGRQSGRRKWGGGGNLAGVESGLTGLWQTFPIVTKRRRPSFARMPSVAAAPWQLLVRSGTGHGGLLQIFTIIGSGRPRWRGAGGTRLPSIRPLHRRN